ncbi:12083_t:CDS:2 [Funneliformis geosporum]|uniref:12083_t:CDS:1 n=1 Tax=Funneliformis geosporum TaxID=1117311 RepID=A0A9W4T4W7_9GLOM|nr:12083_t:CDS:2 [Funneliformis geosporum]
MTVILKTKDRDFSVDSESNTESIFETGNKFGFSQNDMAKWDQPVEVSIGVNTSFFIAREAVIYGLRCDNVYLYPELAADTKWKFKKGNFDEIIILLEKKKINIHTLLFRGKRDFGKITRIVLYTTPSINYALIHIRDYGSSRGYICIRNSAKQGPPQFKEDIFSGTITENNNDIRTCSEPVARKDPERN